MAAAFAPDILDWLRTARTVRIETVRAPGPEVHRTIIWVVVDERDRVLVRSWRGARARWYREVLANPRCALIGPRKRAEAIAAHVADAERIEACSAGLRAKYAGDPATTSMVRDEVLRTTLELTPA